MAIGALADVLVDTSAWIDFFRGVEPMRSAARRLCDDGRAAIAGIVLAELLVRVRSAQQAAHLAAIREALPLVEESVDDWLAAARYVREARASGVQLGLADCVIAALAVRLGMQVLTTDRHFAEMERVLGIRLTEV
jgi:predicted nucleic acid-binding protein